MSYVKQNFYDGQVLTAQHLNRIEDGIVGLEKAIKPTPTISEITLRAADWKGTENPYSQVVTVDGITSRSQVDLTPSVEQLVIFHEKDLAFVAENDSGVVTVYAIGQKPTNDYTIQVTITEVNV